MMALTAIKFCEQELIPLVTQAGELGPALQTAMLAQLVEMLVGNRIIEGVPNKLGHTTLEFAMSLKDSHKGTALQINPSAKNGYILPSDLCSPVMSESTSISQDSQYSDSLQKYLGPLINLSTYRLTENHSLLPGN